MKNLLKITMFLIIVSSNFSIIGCASTKKSWYKPNMDQDGWTIDSASCQTRASKLADKGLRRSFRETSNGIRVYRSYRALMESHDANKNREHLYRKCMETKGYQLITPVASPQNEA